MLQSPLDLRRYTSLVELLRCYMALGRYAVVDKLYGALSDSVVCQALYELLRDIASMAREFEVETFQEHNREIQRIVVAKGEKNVKNALYALKKNETLYAAFDPRNLRERIRELLEGLSNPQTRQQTLLLIRKIAAEALGSIRTEV